MNETLRAHAEAIARCAIQAVKPEESVRQVLERHPVGGNVYLAAVGKAACAMAGCALAQIPQGIRDGIVITKYGHASSLPEPIRCFEAGHPVPDGNGVRGTKAMLKMTANLTCEDTVLFLLSGGGSALFEDPLIPLEELQDITNQLLQSGADIVQINTIRKRLSGVKGGRFAQWCAPAKVMTVVLSDVLGDPLDMIASGPAAPDRSTSAQALEIVQKYNLRLSAQAMSLLEKETPKTLPNVESYIIGSVRELIRAAEIKCRELGYETRILTAELTEQARTAGNDLGLLLKAHAMEPGKIAFLAGGETVVRVTGTGLGGRNQELVLGAAVHIAGLPGAAIISVGSDGTDGPTDAAGGYADGDTLEELVRCGMNLQQILDNNDSYHGLRAVNGLIFTGPTGTNVNDLTVALLNNSGE